MKTITLTDEAYERIAALKTSPKDSFSKVILRCLPKHGTAAQLLAAVSQLPPLSEAQARTMEDVASENNDWNNWRDPWTTSSTPIS
jgi:predicted CopG family antitoxin